VPTIEAVERPRFALPQSTILVVDDSPVNLQLLVRTLHGSGHRILAAKDGRAAIEIARRARPDLMLLDVMMPEIDGFEVCRSLKADPETEETVVIFLSALGEVSDKVSGLKLGAVDYITKPIQPEEVLARVETHLTRQYLERELRQSRDRLDRELESAAAMQRLILPRAMPIHQSVEFAAYYRTGRHAGGDYYDVLELGADRYGIMVADVSGHGAPAAIVMAMIRAVLHMHPAPDDPPSVLQDINRHFHYFWESGIFATAIYLVIDARRGTLRLSCAGHQPPLLARASGDVARVAADSVVPLLLMELPDVPSSECSLRAGDRLLLYTDGITDREAPDGTMFDEERLTAALGKLAAFSPSVVIDSLVADVEAFAGGREPRDDQTLVLMGFSGVASDGS
jgi:sigma-B regulation protein RsbU (phosphoserine phosphatase)